MGQKGERDVLVSSAQVARGGTDGNHVEPFRSPLHRLAPIVLAALGILGALLTIFAGLLVLNDSVLPFKGWPLDAERLNTGAQLLPRAPVETGRLRTAPGEALAAAPGVVAPLVGSSSPLLRGTVVSPLSTVPQVTVRIRHRMSHPVTHRTESKPAPQPPAPAPAPASAPAATPAPAPAPAATPVVSAPAPVARRPVTASRQPSTTTSVASTSHGHGRGNGGGGGRAHAPGQLKKVAAAAAPASAPVPAPAVATPPAANPGQGNGNGHGNGPPPWAHGHH
jgi:hypothetical protein